MVEWKTIEEVFELRNGYTPSKNNPEYWDGGTIPWFRMEDIRQNGHVLGDSIQHITPISVKKSGLFPANTIIMATTATIGEHALVIVDSLANQQFTGLVTRKSLVQSVLPRFAFYYCFLLGEWCKQHIHQGGFASVDMEGFKKYPFPIPSLSEQERIVGILDTFTAGIENIKEQIAQRRKQYEYYRDELLDLEGKDGVEMKTLGEVLISLKTGLNPRNNFVLNSSESANYYITVRELGMFNIKPIYKTDKVSDEALKLINNRSNLEEGDVLFSGTGTIGRTALVKEKPKNWNIKEGVYSLKPRKDCVNSYFLVQLLHTNTIIDKISALVVGDPIRSIPMKSLVSMIIPVPSLQDQRRIVSILDTFEASIANLEAQLKQREKQYEYYRNKLLTFE